MLDTKARSASARLATEPLGHGQIPWALDVSSRSPSPLSASAREANAGRGLGVTAELGEIAAMERDQRGTLTSMLAARPTVGSNGSSARAGGRALGRVEQRFHRLQATAGGGHERLRQQQPGAGPDQVIGKR